MTSFLISVLGYLSIMTTAKNEPVLSDFNSATIRYRVLCSDVNELKSGIYRNCLIEYDPLDSQVKTITDSMKVVEFVYDISKPSMVELLTNIASVRYRFYIQPGDFLEVEIGCNEVFYYGDRLAENNALKKLELDKFNLVRPRFGKLESIAAIRDAFNISEIMDSIDDHYSKLYSAVAMLDFGPDFKKYIEAERVGFIYFWKYNYIYDQIGDTIAIDSLAVNEQERIRQLFEIPLIDENRSRYYLNSLSTLAQLRARNALTAKERNNYYTWLTEYSKQMEKLVSFSTEIRTIFEMSFVNTVVYKAQTIEQLEYSQYIFDQCRLNIPSQEPVFKIIQEELDRKRIRFNLSNMKDYDLMSQIDSSFHLSESLTQSTYTFLYFWATWCAPCLDKMPVVLAMANEDLNVVPVNMWSSSAAWTKAITKFDAGKAQHLFASKATSDMIAHDCAFRSMPFLAIVDSNLNILHIPKDLDDAKVIISNLLKD